MASYTEDAPHHLPTHHIQHPRKQVGDAALRCALALLRDAPVVEDYLELPAAPEGVEVVFDYASLGLKLRAHPMAMLRD